jgi:hypothetical protein
MVDADIDDKASLYAEAILGQDADEFWKSDIGRYVIMRSKEETDRIISEIKTVSPEGLSRLQTDWVIAEKALIWINDAIVAGRQALNQLNDLQDRA